MGNQLFQKAREAVQIAKQAVNEQHSESEKAINVAKNAIFCICQFNNGGEKTTSSITR
jgi:hypothetical protein